MDIKKAGQYLQKLILDKTSFHDWISLTVIIMILGHCIMVTVPDMPILRIPDRILVLFFFVPIGYNAGHKISYTFYAAALAVILATYLLYGQLFPLTMLFALIVARYYATYVVPVLTNNIGIFWAVQIVLLLLLPWTQFTIAFGTLILMTGTAGWLIKNMHLFPRAFVTEYLIFTWIAHIFCAKLVFNYSLPILSLIGIGSACILWILYHTRTLLLNDLKNKSSNFLTRAKRFISHKSLEIYAVHVIFLDVLNKFVLSP